MALDTLSSDALFQLAQTKAATAQLSAKTKNLPNSIDPAREIAEEFESVFLNTMLESMFAGIKTDGPFSGGQAESMYRSMMNQEYAKSIAATGGIGIADNLYSEILKLQEAKTAENE